MERNPNKQGQNLPSAAIRIRTYDEAMDYITKRMVNGINDVTDIDRAKFKHRELLEQTFIREAELRERAILAEQKSNFLSVVIKVVFVACVIALGLIIFN